MDMPIPARVFAALRISFGFIFLWAFFDKLVGLGFSTPFDKSWLAGVSPTAGFLKFGVQGPLAAQFQTLAGSVLIDWLFMLGLLGIGLALTLGIALRLARLGGIIILLLIYASLFPPEHHPFIDEHIIYALVLIFLPTVKAGHTWGLGSRWNNLRLIRSYPFLG